MRRRGNIMIVERAKRKDRERQDRELEIAEYHADDPRRNNMVGRVEPLIEDE